MAIIKCPECGHQVSEMAPTCPSCGVQIAGKVTRCPDCGEVYFSNQAMCPSCHRPSAAQAAPVRPVQQQPVTDSSTSAGSDQDNNQEEPKKKSYVPLVVSFIFALLVCGVCWYFYNDANTQKEREDYEFAMKSDDPMVLQSYLDRYKDADPAHRDSIQAHLALLQEYDEDWTNAVVSGTKTALEDYIKQHPDSPHKADALNKIDSLDFMSADKEKTAEAYKAYVAQHPDGKFIDQVNEALKKINDSQVQPEEAQIVKGIFRKFFQSINSRNEDGLLATVAEPMTSLLNKNGASKADVVTFMNRLYKENISNMNWHIIDDYKIDKLQVSDDTFEFNAEFTAEQNKDLKDGTKEVTRFHITGTVDSEGKISRFLLTKLAE